MIGAFAMSPYVSENPGTTTVLYYTAAWQVIEELTVDTSEPGVTTTTVVQNTWSPAYIDAMIERDVTVTYSSSGEGGGLDGLVGGDGPDGGFGTNGVGGVGAQRPIPGSTGRLYVQQDANWNTTALTVS
jgi:hypothetical protein